MANRSSDLSLSSQTDERLVEHMRGGDGGAFAVIVERYGPELHRQAIRLRGRTGADDLVQQTFLRAFAAVQSGVEIKHLRGWLYRILRNEAIRSSNQMLAEVELDPSELASEPLEELSQRRMLAFETLSSIAELPARQRDALLATTLDGQSRAAVAGSMGVSEGAVRQLMHRARAALRTAVTAVTPAPVANWLTTVRGAPGAAQAPEIALGAGATSAGGIAVKLGAVVASGVLATGLVGSQLGSPRAAHPAAPLRPPHRAVAAVGHAPAVAAAPVHTVFAVKRVVAQPAALATGRRESVASVSATPHVTGTRRAESQPSGLHRVSGRGEHRDGEHTGDRRDGGDRRTIGTGDRAGATSSGRDGGDRHDGASSPALVASAPSGARTSSDGSDGGLASASRSDGGGIAAAHPTDTSGG